MLHNNYSFVAMLFILLSLVATLVMVVAHSVHDRLDLISQEVSFASKIKLYGALKQNGAGNAVSHAEVIAKGHLSPLKVIPRLDDLQMRHVLSEEYHKAIDQTFFRKNSNRLYIIPLRVTVLVLVGDKRRDIWSRLALPKVCIIKGVALIRKYILYIIYNSVQ